MAYLHQECWLSQRCYFQQAWCRPRGRLGFSPYLNLTHQVNSQIALTQQEQSRWNGRRSLGMATPSTWGPKEGNFGQLKESGQGPGVWGGRSWRTRFLWKLPDVRHPLWLFLRIKHPFWENLFYINDFFCINDLRMGQGIVFPSPWWNPKVFPTNNMLRAG